MPKIEPCPVDKTDASLEESVSLSDLSIFLLLTGGILAVVVMGFLFFGGLSQQAEDGMIELMQQIEQLSKDPRNLPLQR
ncbi:hypothetical protein [Paremcibacter congregatus]|uniref:Uncharacterized protein n=1 Tax=Paremcibacter congregatus TaxID=2043170 RepID=A0A2G4YQZ9_9PROT|nr:hypothetical protein [Paremcibacter congregatus]PHZ84752.1 hypothetical protein CRD36_10730 [Paremcibacter congregatus]QDE28944.1 hypothetical protein FIV45_17495 [Paremcibacter congregatus]